MAVTIAALGVLSVAWAVHSLLSRDSGSPTAQAPESVVPRDSGASWTTDFASNPFERAPARSAPAVENPRPIATAERPARQNAPGAPSTEPAAEPSIVTALDDPDEETRYRLLQEVRDSDDFNVPEDKLREMLTEDRSDRVREQALNALTERPDLNREQIRAEAQAGVTNSSATVRGRAQRILEQLDQLDRMDEQARQDILAHGGRVPG